MGADDVSRIEQRCVGEAVVFVVDGALDLLSYAMLLDTLLKCAIDGPRAIVVNISLLQVPTPATWPCSRPCGCRCRNGRECRSCWSIPTPTAVVDCASTA